MKEKEEKGYVHNNTLKKQCESGKIVRVSEFQNVGCGIPVNLIPAAHLLLQPDILYIKLRDY